MDDLHKFALKQAIDISKVKIELPNFSCFCPSKYVFHVAMRIILGQVAYMLKEAPGNTI